MKEVPGFSLVMFVLVVGQSAGIYKVAEHSPQGCVGWTFFFFFVSSRVAAKNMTKPKPW